MTWYQTSHCVRCQKLIHKIIDYPEAGEHSNITNPYCIVTVSQLCDECLANGWRFNWDGSIVNEYDKPEVSLLDLLEEEN